ncbi:hypothetical protein VNO80_09541 [Phaseolus coccineus]|uniref:Uncharacterized protein n=1 Tax=Phaseolus coccineus TaxID=3886 RepID=A0AAN9NBN5_PHACN
MRGKGLGSRRVVHSWVEELWSCCCIAILGCRDGMEACGFRDLPSATAAFRYVLVTALRIKHYHSDEISVYQISFDSTGSSFLQTF